MNNTPRERFRKTLDISTGVSELLADSNASYISWLETELTAVTKQRDEYKAALQSADNHNHEIGTKLEIVTEQRDRLAEAIRKYTGGCYPESFLLKTLRSLNPK